MFSLLEDKNQAHQMQVYKYDIKNQICFFSLIQPTTSPVSTIFQKFLRHGLKETNLYKSNHPQVFRITGATVGAQGITAGGVLTTDVHLWTLVDVW